MMEAHFILTLDTTAPTVTIESGPDYSTIFEKTGPDISTFEWSVDKKFTEYKICAVPSNTALHSVGRVISTANGSINMAGIGLFEEKALISSSIKGRDLRTASPEDGAKIIKIFVKDEVGNWSVN